MKIRCFYIILFVFISFNTIGLNVNKGKPIVTIKFTFTGIVDSCDYINRINVYINEVKLATSSEKKQSEANSVTFSIKKGKYKLKVTDEVLFQGKWEEQTILNNYNIDAVLETEIEVKGNTSINMIFDLDKGVSIVTP